MKKNFWKSTKALLPFLVVLAIITVSMPRNGEFEYHYRKGGQWNYETLVAPFSFPILKTPEQIQAEKERLGSTYVPYYSYDVTVYEHLDEAVDNTIGVDHPEIAQSLLSHLYTYYKRGVLPDAQFNLGMEADESKELVYVQKDKRAAKTPKAELYRTSTVKYGVLTALQAEFPDRNIDSLLEESNVYKLMVSNLVFDKQTTEIVHQESTELISPTSGTFPAGDIIVSTGEIITSDIAQILDSFRAEYEDTIGYNGPNYLLWLGNLGIALILCLLLGILLYFIGEKGGVMHYNEYLFVITLFTSACIVAFVCTKIPTALCYMIPYPVYLLFFRGFFRKRVVLPLYVLCLLPLLILLPNGAELFMIYLLSGFVGVIAFEHFNKGWKQFITALLIFVSAVFVYIINRLVAGALSQIDFATIGLILLGSLFCIFTYPLTYLFELIFNLMSANRLTELTDTGRPLLRELADKTPGTFQHSLALMNMADAAATSIDADVLLIRAAALYHDVGKILNPMCFIENQAPGVKYHDVLSAKESAADIIRHVTDGIAVCEKYGVPKVIREFVLTHHGTTTAGYFWTKYLNDGGSKDDVALFTYPGPKPKTKEQAILMFCDTLEAASRVLEDFSPDRVSDFVDRIYNEKFEAGQFDEADITLGELNTVKETVKNYIVQVHHGRIAYPARKKNK